MRTQSAVSSYQEASERWLPALLLLFVGSGTAALVYEVLWFQLLELVIGSSSVSLGVLLGTFMGGMCLGSLLLPRFVSTKHHPLKVYAFLELSIGAIGLLILVLMPVVGSLYTHWGGYGLFGFLLRGLVAAFFLLPPTLAMGATLPAIARWVESTPKGVSWLGFFYSSNIAGAVFGCLLAGFYLLRVHNVYFATYVAAAINLTVAVIALLLSRVVSYQPPKVTEPAQEKAAKTESGDEAGPEPAGTRMIYVVIGMSGLCALAAEVLWTRSLGLLFGASVYAFSIILAVFLFGLGIGSSVGSFLSRSVKSPRVALGWCQVAVAAAMAWSAYALHESLPYWPVDPSLSTSIWFNYQLDIVRGLWAMLPAAILWGASFPLALASVVRKGDDPGKPVGWLYAANTVGAIIGSLGVSLLMVAWVGTQRTQQILILLAVLAGLLALAHALREPGPRGKLKWGTAVPLICAALAAALLARSVVPVPGLLIARGRYSASYVGLDTVIYTGEGVHASVAVTRSQSGALNYHNAGKIQASSEIQDMRLQRMLGHMTTLLPDDPSSVLVIGCGAGVTAGAVSISPEVDQVTIAEIEPLVPEVVSRFFAKENYSVVTNPKVRIQIDDARHFLLTTDQTFDAITSDPLDPWVKGAAMLYTTEFWNVAKEHLNPGGVVTVFVQLYESTPESVESEVATFLNVFPNGVVFSNTQGGEGYDMVLVGSVEPLEIDVDAIQEKLRRPEFQEVATSLSELGFFSATELFATYGGNVETLEPWYRDAPINTDGDLRLQYLAGMGVHLYQAPAIHRAMIAYRKYPEGLFTGSEETIQRLRTRIRPGPLAE